MTGPHDIIAEISAPDVSALGELIVLQKIQSVVGVQPQPDLDRGGLARPRGVHERIETASQVGGIGVASQWKLIVISAWGLQRLKIRQYPNLTRLKV